jgi:predicted transposase YbfD/YdcC
MEAVAIALVLSMFAAVPDPRARNARHRLVDVLAIALLAVLSGSDDYPGIVAFGRDRAEFLGGLLALPHGIPSVSTFRRVFAAVDPTAMGEVLGRWSKELVKTCAGKQIAIDGKALRQSFEHAWDKMGMLHLVTAWCVEDGVCLAQSAVDEKSNEIVAVPKVLDLLDIKGAVITVDALNTQKSIAAQIVDAGGDYVMALKDNHPTLFDRVVRNVDDLILERFKDVPHTAADDTDAGHGRIDRRQVHATDRIAWLTDEQRAEWAGLRSVAVVTATRKLDDGTVQRFRRYYLTSLPPDAKELGRLIRNHWGIENGQHWCLDVGFREDQSRVRADHGDENLAAVRRIALNLLKQDKSVKLGIANKRLKAARCVKYLVGLITGTTNAK